MITVTDVALARDEPITVGAESTDTPGLAVTPGVTTDRRYDGGFTLTHTASGRRVVADPSTTLAYARELAILMADVADWTRPATEIIDDEHTAAQLRAVNRRYFATTPGAPVWWARWSWRRTQPCWVVQYVDEFGDRMGQAPVSWHQLLQELDRDADDYCPDAAPAAAWYDPRPLWLLCCAAPLCPLPSLLGDDEHTCYSPHRDELRATAIGNGWRRVEPGRWLCPGCAVDHDDRRWWR